MYNTTEKETDNINECVFVYRRNSNDVRRVVGDLHGFLKELFLFIITIAQNNTYTHIFTQQHTFIFSVF